MVANRNRTFLLEWWEVLWARIIRHGSRDFELDSFAACFVALDAASKAANVRIQNIERNRLGAGACVKSVVLSLM